MPKAARQRRLKESHLSAPVASWLALQGLRVHHEVKLASKRVDVVGLPERDAEDARWIGIELKLTKWRAALQQAWANTIAFDHNYVALWHKAVAPAMLARERFEQAGVGLISVSDEGCEVLIFPMTQQRFGQAATKAAVRERLVAG